MAALTGCALPSAQNSLLPTIVQQRSCQWQREAQATFISPGRRSSACLCAAYALSSLSSSFQQEESLSVELEAIASQEQFDAALALAQQRSQPIIIDWMAAWCRKCIYLKPKLEKLAAEFQPNVKFYCVDVNAVPQTLVKRADVTKMPTIQLWKDGDKWDEVIGGQKAWLVIEEVREMLQKHLDSSQ